MTSWRPSQRTGIGSLMLPTISVHLAPVLFGAGTPLFAKGESLDEHVRLERTECITTDAATHLRFRVVR